MDYNRDIASIVLNPVLGRPDGEFDQEDKENLLTYIERLTDPEQSGFEAHAPGEEFSLNYETEKGNLTHLNHLLEEEIEPRYPIFLQINEYELYRSDVINASLEPWFLAMTEADARWTLHRSHYDKGNHVLWYALIENYEIGLIILIVFLLSAQTVMEKSLSSNHLSLLKMSGVTAVKLYLTKFILLCLVSMVMILLPIMGVFGTSLFFNGVGSYRYPLFHFSYPADPNTLETHETSMMYLGTYLIQNAFLIFSCVMFILAITLLLGQFFRSEMVVTLIGFGLVGLSQILPLHHASPFAYFDTHRIINGSVIFQSLSHLHTFEYGILHLWGWIILLVVSGCILYHRNWKKRQTYFV
ncbi:hypothetical protein ACS127_15635 [Amphibacillus sp. Q70]|uniref:hypothetical protein n=1 Tax=Amphibacillus sp. Q70 TaxID=3453416 RepID=UPI003F868AE8